MLEFSKPTIFVFSKLQCMKYLNLNHKTCRRCSNDSILKKQAFLIV